MGGALTWPKTLINTACSRLSDRRFGANRKGSFRPRFLFGLFPSISDPGTGHH